MAAFFPDLLEDFCDSRFLLSVCNKFHYEKGQVSVLGEVAGEMLLLMRREAFWERKKAGSLLSRSWTGGSRTLEYEAVVMSLGSGIDSLQEDYHKKGLFSESYMLEVLSGELLLKGYGAYNRYVKENSSQHVARYHFPGNEEDFPLEMLGELLQDFNCQITCNSAFCMIPKKSVLFIAEMTEDERVMCESICMGCRNMHCPNRTEDDSPGGRMMAKMADFPLNYGYGRIFGKL